MNEQINRATVDALVAAINGRDLEAFDKVFSDDIVMDWPQSGERVNGGQSRREIYGRFPSLPRVTPRRLTGSGDFGCWRPVWITATEIRSNACSCSRCVTV